MESRANNPNKGMNTKRYLLLVAAAAALLIVAAMLVVGKSSTRIVPHATVPASNGSASPQ
jgi:hypothetical protein